VDAGDDRLDIFLHPGEFCFAGEDTRIRTLLGSCVSFTAWHRRRRLGAMCHFVLPTRRTPRAQELDGRYGDEAVLWFRNEAVNNGTRPEEYEIKVFGGGEMFGGAANQRRTIGGQNSRHILRLLDQLGHDVVAHHVGGTGHRNIIFDIASGDVWVRHVPIERGSRQEKAA